MFDLGWSEILVIAVIGILVVGPKDLPRLMKTIGEWVAKARRMASHFQSGVDEMIRQAELEDLRKDLNTIRKDLRSPVMDPRTTTTPPPDNLMVSLGEKAGGETIGDEMAVSEKPGFEPLPLPGPIEGPIAPPAPQPAAETLPVLPPKAANQ